MYNYLIADNGKFDSSETDFIERMRLQIKQNLILKIRNVHICYERRSSTQLGHPFSFGVTLHYLELTVRIIFIFIFFFQSKMNHLDSK